VGRAGRGPRDPATGAAAGQALNLHLAQATLVYGWVDYSLE
jgi:hypothetical protein